MNFYQVTTNGQQYTFHARNIQVASQFVRHWRPGVIVTRINYAQFLGMLRNRLTKATIRGDLMAASSLV